jgi:hypothetical protein
MDRLDVLPQQKLVGLQEVSLGVAANLENVPRP